MHLPERIELERLIHAAIIKNISDETRQWLQEKAAGIQTENTSHILNSTFVMVPRKTGNKSLMAPVEITEKISVLAPGFTLQDWTIDRLTRFWLLMQIPSSNKSLYHNKIDTLFNAAEMNEQVALYSSLFILNYPADWQSRCAEGIRSNIGTVLEAIMYNNPYPSQNLDENAWNQMVLKAFFTEKYVNRIIGLDERANAELASILIDYADERWSAHRTVNPQLWRLLSGFIDEPMIPYFQKLLNSNLLADNQAAALACYRSSNEAAKDLLKAYPDLINQIQQNKLSWSNL